VRHNAVFCAMHAPVDLYHYFQEHYVNLLGHHWSVF